MFSRREFFQGLLALPPVRAMVDELDQARTLRPTLLRVNVPVRGLDRRLDGMRIAQISDAHIGLALGLDHLVKAVQLLDADPPDLLAVTGDLLDDADYGRACFDVLARVKAPYGRFFIMGNHDVGAGRDRVLAAGRRCAAFRVLANEEVDVEVQGARFHVSGVDSAQVPGEWDLNAPQLVSYVQQSTRRLADGDFRLCLVHHPDNFDTIRARGVELTLAGHTHGGQLAPLGPLMQGRMFKYVRGLYTREDSHLYVSGGTGHWFPLRIGVPAEVTELTLRRV
ncbi:MAG: metallophosphoesterase [Deltaproteobacteria bacterium]|nr:metallophosphoesterase [Deltaproteobacteria bacterium]